MYQLKIAIRNLLRNGLYSWINVTGLAVSLSAVILVMLWINDEISFDRFHKRSKDIHLVLSTYYSGTYWTASSSALAPAGIAEIPEVENACRVSKEQNVQFLKHNENVLSNIHSSMVDLSFFSIFDIAIKEGDPNRLFDDDHAVVLSESAAKVLFKDDDPIGKFIADNNGRQYHVTGIFADMPKNSSMRYNAIFSFSLFESTNLQSTNQMNMGSLWRTLRVSTYFLLRPGADAKPVADKLNAIHQKNDSWELTYSLFPLQNMNLYNLDGSANSKMQACRLFSIAIGVLLLIACINYVNLVTSRASRRNKEIFARIVMGARKRDLFVHFFKESLLLFFCSLFAATLLIYFLFPFYNLLTDKQLEFQLFSALTMKVYGIAFAATMLFAGIYPAFKLSHGTVVQKASGARFGRGAWMKKTLAVMQFSASVVLILAATTMNRQLHFIKAMNPGYDREHVFYLSIPQNMVRQKDAVKARLSQTPGIMGVTFMNQNLTNLYFGGIQIGWEGKDVDSENLPVSILQTDADFIPLMNIKMAEGTNFSGTLADSSYCILNQMAVKTMGLEEAIGTKMYVMNGREIIGITEDFHFQDLHEPIKPLIIVVTPQTNFMYVKAGPHNVSAAVKAVETVYKEYTADIPFEYRFMDDEFNRIYQADIRTGNLFNVFAVIAIFVSCLGLFGLVTYTAETKIKEIGIRKVLGASIMDMVFMLSKEFLVLVCIAMLFAFPLAYYLLDKMLQDFAYRIEVGWLMFAFAGSITLTITFVTVGWRAIKAATANPVNAIRSEG